MLCATYPQAIGYNLGMCNDEIDRHLKEISQTDEQMDGVLKGELNVLMFIMECGHYNMSLTSKA